MSRTVIIIPTYNEVENVEAITRAARLALPDADILVVDDNSPDGTADAVRALSAADDRIALLLRAGKEGIGKAYLHAFSEVLKNPDIDWVQTLDADFSHDPAYLPVLKEAGLNADVVIGSRYARGGGTVAWALWRQWLSKCANFYCYVITGMPVTDSTSGFHLIRASTLRNANFEGIDASGHAFLIQLKYVLWKTGARITEIPVVLKDREKGVSKISRRILLEAVVAPWKMRFGRIKKHSV
jgi:dolichol-phosphate mannosyltransferase